MESMLSELTQAVTMGSTYLNLLRTGKFAYEGISIQLKDQKNIEVYLGNILLAEGKKKILDNEEINDSIDWTILNTNPLIVDIFHTTVSNMSTDLIREYGNYY